jgi:trehalose-6-phosphate synthase
VEPSGGRLIVVANRLPVTCSKDAAGKWKLQISAGGLVSALMGVNNYSTLWIGWPGEMRGSSNSSCNSSRNSSSNSSSSSSSGC